MGRASGLGTPTALSDGNGAVRLSWRSPDEGIGFEASVFTTNELRLGRTAPQAEAEHRGVVCVSSQVGCNVGCKFCATGRTRVARNLSTAEIVDQAEVAAGFLPPDVKRSVTFSGMGEPLHNLDAVLDAADRLVDNRGFEYASLSTVGIPIQLRRLAERRPATHLFVSLHATTNKVRRSLIPRTCFPLSDVLAAARQFSRAAGRRVKLSYLLLPGINDSEEDVERLVDLADPEWSLIQVLAWNAVPGMAFARASEESTAQFCRELIDRGAVAYHMPSMGQELGGGCGQLAARRGDADNDAAATCM